MPRATPVDPTDPDSILRGLGRCRRLIDAADAARDARMDLWLAARALTPPVTYARLAAESGVAEPYVIREVGKRIRAEAAAVTEAQAVVDQAPAVDDQQVKAKRPRSARG